MVIHPSASNDPWRAYLSIECHIVKRVAIARPGGAHSSAELLSQPDDNGPVPPGQWDGVAGLCLERRLHRLRKRQSQGRSGSCSRGTDSYARMAPHFVPRSEWSGPVMVAR